MITTISNLSVQSSLTTALQAEQSTLTQLSTQLATQQEYTNLTDYTPTDARNLINLQSTATQKQAYINVINTVGNNLSIYNTTLTDLESVVTQAQGLADDSPTYSASTASDVALQAGNFLNSVTVDLNQQINGRYIYSGTRYDTAPVQNLATLPASTLSPTIYTDGQTVPSYDSASTLAMSTSGQTVTIGGTVGSSQTASVTINNTVYSYTVQPGDTLDTIASGLQNVLTGAGISSTLSGASLTVTGAGDTLDSAVATATSTAAYATDTATIDTGDTVNYGITSNNPSMQQMIAGLRYLQAAGNATDSATYQADIQQASSLLTTALTGLQAVNTTVAFNINLMTSEKAAQNTAITNLTNQVDNIQQVDVTQVSTEITAMQTILQASYAVTGDIEKMSIVNYL